MQTIPSRYLGAFKTSGGYAVSFGDQTITTSTLKYDKNREGNKYYIRVAPRYIVFDAKNDLTAKSRAYDIGKITSMSHANRNRQVREYQKLWKNKSQYDFIGYSCGFFNQPQVFYKKDYTGYSELVHDTHAVMAVPTKQTDGCQWMEISLVALGCQTRHRIPLTYFRADRPNYAGFIKYDTANPQSVVKSSYGA